MGAGLLAKAVIQSLMYRLTLRIREQARSHTSPLPQVIFSDIQIAHKQKGPLSQRAFFCVSDSGQNLNTSISVRIGVAIGIFGFCGSAGLAACTGACLRGASAMGGWLANGLRATDNCCAKCCNNTPWA